MPAKLEKFVNVYNDLVKQVDIDDSRGRSVPVNMNFIESGYLTKDTGVSLYGATETTLCHSLFNYKKKDGTSYFIRANGTKLQKYNTSTGVWDNIGSTITMTIAAPAVVTYTAHGLIAGSTISFSTTGALPTGVTAGTTYYVIATGLTADAFQFSTTLGGAAVTTSGTQSGVHTLSRVYTAGAEFGWLVYDDILYGGNAVEATFSWNGTTFAVITAAPKGNIIESFEDRIFISGVTAEPLTLYWSNAGVPTTWTGTDIAKPLGTDSITGLKNYYGSLLVFKKESIWKQTFVYAQDVVAFVPKIELQSGNYGACSRKAISWVENDIWFFTGREVRSIGFKDTQIGALGVNKTVISDSIKETLYTISQANYGQVSVFYYNRRFYLSVPLTASVNDTTFVCHLLYSNAWTKYTSRIKASANSYAQIDGVVYIAKSATPFGVLKSDTVLLNDNGVAISSEAYFVKNEDKDFNKFIMYRYIDLMFKNLTALVAVTIKEDANDQRTSKTNSFFVDGTISNELSTLGEVPPGEDLVADGFGQAIESSPFIKKRVSFLSKAQSVTIGLSNARVDETFTIAEYALSGSKEPRNQFNPNAIVSVS